MHEPVISMSRRTRRTPFTSRIEAQGVGGFTVYNHMLLPTFFRGIEEDYHHLKRHVQVWDVTCEQQVEVVGPHAARLVQLMTSRDISRLAPGRCAYAPMVDETGGMINDPVILRLADDRFWISLADSDVALWGKGLALGLNLDARVFEPGVGPIAVQGPRADDLVSRVLGDEVRDIRFFGFATLPFAGHAFVVARSGWSKQGGFEIYIDDAAIGQALWDALFDAGGDLRVGPGCPNLIERIEGALLSHGNDMTLENNPFECDLGRFVSLDSPVEFIGRDALERIRNAGGPQRIIRGIRFDGAAAPACVEPWPLLVSGTPVGRVTSAAFSPDLATNIALAMVESSAWDPGTRVSVATPEGERDAEVTTLPFITRSRAGVPTP